MCNSLGTAILFHEVRVGVCQPEGLINLLLHLAAEAGADHRLARCVHVPFVGRVRPSLGPPRTRCALPPITTFAAAPALRLLIHLHRLHRQAAAAAGDAGCLAELPATG